MTITRADLLDALEHAHRNGANVRVDPKQSNAENFARIMQAGDDAGQEALKRHTFVLCDCCSHPKTTVRELVK